MPYAANGKISQSPIDGGISISQAKYTEALEGMQSGKVVSIVSGAIVVALPPQPDPPDEAAPAPEPTVGPVLRCLATLSIDDGDVNGLNTDSGIVMAFSIGDGQFMAFFEQPFGIANYGWNVSSTSGQANVTERSTGYLVITVADAVEPFDLSVQIYGLG